LVNNVKRLGNTGPFIDDLPQSDETAQLAAVKEDLKPKDNDREERLLIVSQTCPRL
jgi:hypothetical protein